jgi:hypothetical protein
MSLNDADCKRVGTALLTTGEAVRSKVSVPSLASVAYFLDECVMLLIGNSHSAHALNVVGMGMPSARKPAIRHARM